MPSLDSQSEWWDADSGVRWRSSPPLAAAAKQPYVTEFLSFTLDRLYKEPELMRVDAERIRRQMQEVAVNNYRAFISAADALESIHEEVILIDKQLELLLVLDSHRWVPIPSLGVTTGKGTDDVTPPSSLMEHPPLVLFSVFPFFHCMSMSLNELRPCAPVSLKHALAQELQNGLQVIVDSLVRYNATRMLRDNEPVLFPSLCRALRLSALTVSHALDAVECYVGGAALIELKNSFDGVRRFLVSLVEGIVLQIMQNHWFMKTVRHKIFRRKNLIVQTKEKLLQKKIPSQGFALMWIRFTYFPSCPY